MKIIAVYPGRFQPFHKGHAQVYRWLKSKFGNAHIATSNKVELPKSPFTYEEKKRMMILAGVNASDITEVRNPYLAPEILKNYDGSKTVLVFAVSQKDMDEDPRFTFKPTKTGKASYLQPYKEGANLKPFGDPDKPIGYVTVTPTFNFDVLGEPMKSATEVRKQFANTDFNTQKEIIKDLFGSYDKSIHTLMNKKLKIAQTSVSKIRAKAKTIKEESLDDIGELDHEKFGPMLDSFVQFASKKLGIKSMPQLQLQKQEMTTSFGGYNPQNQSIVVVSRNRHPMDIFRTVAHELVHHKQKEDGKIGKNISLEGSTGSPQENEANAEAGKIMRWFAKSNPEAFKSGYVVEGMTTSGGIRGLGNVTGEVSPTVDSQYVLDNLGYQHPQLQDNTTKGLYSFSDDNWWMDKDGSKKYRMKSGPKTVLKEGLYDPVRGVAIIGGGPPGSGKDYLGKKLVLPHGFREINSDNAFEHLMRKGGLDPKMPDYQEPQRNRARGRAKEIYSEQERLHLANRNGVFVNGTADDPAKIAMIKKRLEDLGYKTMMMMTHVRDNVSKQRNIERGEQGGRTVPENIRREKWERVQKAKPYYRDMFGPENYVEIDNNDDYRKMTPERAAEIEATHNSIFKSIRKFASTPPENPQINAWRTKEMQRRGITQTPQQPRSFNMTTPVSKSVRMVKEETGSLSLKNWFDKSKSKGGKKGWVQVGGRYEGEPCARQPGQTSTPKCRSSSEAASMTKKEKQYAFKKKQREDPNQPSKSGASRPTMVKTYKNQEESVQMDKKTLQEIKDACYHKVKSRYKVWPSAYASGALVKCRKKGAANWGNKSKVDEAFETFFEEHGAGDFGTDKLRMNYQLATPGQAPAVGKKKKKLAQEDNNLPRYGLPADGIGPEATQYRPMTVSGFGGAWTAGISESVMNWANNPQTQQKYINKYGDLAEQKLTETICKLNEMKSRESISVKRSISKLKEAASYGKDPADTMSMIGIQNKDEVREDQNLVHRKYKVKKKLAEQEQSEDAIETSSSIKGYKKNIHPMSTFEKKSLAEAKPSFGAAFKAARERGETEFSWGKGKFGTLKKGETADQYKSYIASKKAVQPTTPAAPAVTAEPKTTSVVQKPVEQPVKPATAKAATPFKSVGGNTPGDVQPKRNEFTPNPKAFTAERDPENRPLGGELLSGTSETPRSMGKQPETGKFRSGTGKLGSSTPKDIDEESPAWTRSAGKNPEGGLNKKGIASYRAANPGSKLSLAVTTPPSKLKPGSKKAKRRLSFCRRMKGMKSKLTSAKTARDPDSRINKSLRKWNCEE